MQRLKMSSGYPQHADEILLPHSLDGDHADKADQSSLHQILSLLYGNCMVKSEKTIKCPQGSSVCTGRHH